MHHYDNILEVVEKLRPDTWEGYLESIGVKEGKEDESSNPDSSHSQHSTHALRTPSDVK